MPGMRTAWMGQQVFGADKKLDSPTHTHTYADLQVKKNLHGVKNDKMPLPITEGFNYSTRFSYRGETLGDDDTTKGAK